MNDQGIYYFHQGTNYQAYKLLGAQYSKKETIFRVWAPRATEVSLVGDFNDWNILKNPMHMLDDSGIWEITVPNIKEFDTYQFAIKTTRDKWLYKSDPYAYHSAVRPDKVSKVFDINKYKFKDQAWMNNRTNKQAIDQPINIYEVHLGSWRKYQDGNFFDYKLLGQELSKYAKEMGYTHIELMPISEHPYDPSWGYQVTGYYAPTSRFGTPDGFKKLVDICHANGIGVIMDWVPGHFTKDAHGLINFDGFPLYEDSNPLRREHKSWGTRCFDFGRPEILSFLISNAVYWLKEYHLDGLRVDAVAAILYLDYDRERYSKNIYGTNINLEAESFLKQFNNVVHEMFPGIITFAEESTTYPKITYPVSEGGLGFDYKWNMGWMNDTLSYIQKDPIYRQYEHHKLTFQMTYIYSEKFVLPLSHDEVVHGKKSLLDKMPGDYHQKFAGLKTYFMYMMSHPGKKLLFMGGEIGQFIEWNELREIDWLLLQYEEHRQMQDFTKALNKFYLQHPSFYQNEINWEGFNWVSVDDSNHNVIGYTRKSAIETIVCLFNFSNSTWSDYEINIDNGTYQVVFTTSPLVDPNIKYRVTKNKLKLNLPGIYGIYLRKVK